MDAKDNRLTMGYIQGKSSMIIIKKLFFFLFFPSGADLGIV